MLRGPELLLCLGPEVGSARGTLEEAHGNGLSSLGGKRPCFHCRRYICTAFLALGHRVAPPTSRVGDAFRSQYKAYDEEFPSLKSGEHGSTSC